MDIAQASLARVCRRGGQDASPASTPEAAAILTGRPWPGNVRQLLNVIRNIVVLHDGPLVRRRRCCRPRSPARSPPLPASASPRCRPPAAPTAGDRRPATAVELLVGTPLADVERELIEATIAHCDGSIPRAARMLARLALDALPQARELDRGAAPLRHLSRALAKPRRGGAHSRGGRKPGGLPWTCSTPRSASARMPMRPIPASRSAPRSAAPTAASSPAATSRTSPIREGTCAEAGAIAAMVAAGAREIAEVLVVADSPTPVTPCGGCRQKLAEFARAGGAGDPRRPRRRARPHHRRRAAARRLRAEHMARAEP